MRDVYDRTDGRTAGCRIEVDPRLAHDTEATIAEARALWWLVDRPNVMIKIPATAGGPGRHHRRHRRGHQRQRHADLRPRALRAVMDAYLTGLEQAQANGIDLSTIRSVASFFVSRVDTEVDKRLDAIGTDEATRR